MSTNVESNIKPDYVQPIKDITAYITDYVIENVHVYDTARYRRMGSEWGHPSDNTGGILAIGQSKAPLAMKDVLTGMIRAHEIQGVMLLENSFIRVKLMIF